MEDNEKIPTESEEQSQPVEPAAPLPTGGAVLDFEPLDVGGEPPDTEPAEEFIPEDLAEPEKIRGGRFKSIVRKVLTWILIFGLVYLAGVVTLYVLRFKPTEDALLQAQSELVDANQTIEDLQMELDEARFNLSYNAFLEVKADIFVARLALKDEDTSGAKIALGRVEENLNLILDDVTAFDQALANSLVQRLDLILNNVESDTDTALLDAELFTENLQKVYEGVYAEN